ncbi:MAG: thiamine-phosphate kinase [Balneolaceae bacterium]
MSKKKEDFQTIHDIGFSKLLEKLEKFSGVSKKTTIKGIGDDSSVVKYPASQVSISSSKIMMEGVHFDLSYVPLHHLGYKCVTSAVSDIYAMNANPSEILINLAVPNKISVQMIEQLYSGINTACYDYDIQVTGGDLTASVQVLTLSATATGYSFEKDLTYRNGAKSGDLICVTGDLGGALAGLRILLREKKLWQENQEQYFQPDLDDYEYVIQKQLVPKARNDFISVLLKEKIKPTSITDIAKGLITDLKKICNSSEAGAEIYSPSVPIALNTRKVAEEMKEDVDKYAFYGGEDYELLFTIQNEDLEKLTEQFSDFTVIGKITDNASEIIIKTGTDKTIAIETEN